MQGHRIQRVGEETQNLNVGKALDKMDERKEPNGDEPNGKHLDLKTSTTDVHATSSDEYQGPVVHQHRFSSLPSVLSENRFVEHSRCEKDDGDDKHCAHDDD